MHCVPYRPEIWQKYSLLGHSVCLLKHSSGLGSDCSHCADLLFLLTLWWFTHFLLTLWWFTLFWLTFWWFKLFLLTLWWFTPLLLTLWWFTFFWLTFLWFTLFLLTLVVVHTLLAVPKGTPGMSDVSPLSEISGLSFDSTLLSPLMFFCLVLLLFLSYLFFCMLVHSPELFPENSSIFFIKR